MEMIEDVEDAKDAEEARQEPGERVTVEEYVGKREQGTCDAKITLQDRIDGTVRFPCEITGEHAVHLARGEFPPDAVSTLRWKLIWDVQG